MSGVFQNMDPPPPHRPASVYPPPLVLGVDTLAGWRGGGGGSIFIFWKTPDTALYSTYVSALWEYPTETIGGQIYRLLYCIDGDGVLVPTLLLGDTALINIQYHITLYSTLEQREQMTNGLLNIENK
jgi:hypothetical protein